jgi:hypothetical protein
VLLLSLKDLGTGKTASAEIPNAHGPALRSGIKEMRNEIGERASGAFLYEKEDSLTRAISAFGALASVVNTIIQDEDPNYGG